jgi:hypothetical protein
VGTDATNDHVGGDLEEAEEDNKDGGSHGDRVEVNMQIGHQVVGQGVGHVSTVQLEEEDYIWDKEVLSAVRHAM